jgi:hypothetical protein
MAIVLMAYTHCRDMIGGGDKNYNRKGLNQVEAVFTIGKTGNFTADAKKVKAMNKFFEANGMREDFFRENGIPKLGLVSGGNFNLTKVILLRAFAGVHDWFLSNANIPTSIERMNRDELREYYATECPQFKADGKGSLIATNDVLARVSKWFESWRILFSIAVGNKVPRLTFLPQGYCLIPNTNENKVRLLDAYVLSRTVMHFVSRHLKKPMPECFTVL